MTGIKINGEFLVIDNLRVTFEIENSAFSEDIIFSGFSIPGEAPVCEINNRILSFGYKLNLAHKVKQFPCEFHFKGMSIFYGTFNLLETSRKSYRWNMSISGLSALLLDKKLKELNYGSPYVLGDTTIAVLEKINDMANKFYPEIPICFPVTENVSFYGEYQLASSTNQDFKGYLNAWNLTTEEYYKNQIIQAPAQDNIQAFVPWFFVKFLIDTIFENAGWGVSGTFANDPEVSQLIIYSGRALDKTIAQDIFIGESASAQNLVNPIPNNWLVLNVDELEDPGSHYATNFYTVPPALAGSGVADVGYFTFEFDFATHTAFPGEFSGQQKIMFGIIYEDETEFQFITEADNYFLQNDFTYDSRTIVKGQLWIPQSKIGVRFNFAAKHYSEEYVLGNVVSLFVHKVTVSPLSLSTLNVLEGNVNLADFVPDITVRDFLLNIRNQFCLSFVPNLATKTVRIDYVEPNLAKLPVNITSKTNYEYNATIQEAIKFIFDYDWDQTDELEKENFKTIDTSLYIGEFLHESDLPAFPALNRYAYVISSNRYFVSFKDPQTFDVIWKYYSDALYPLEFGDGVEKKIAPKFRPVFMNNAGSDIIQSFRLNALKPVIKAKGNSSCFGLGLSNSQPLKLAVWKGLTEDRDGNLYPFATPYAYDDSGSAVYDFSLKWDFPLHGLFERNWKIVASSLVDTELVEMDVDFNLAELLEFDITRTQLVEDVYYAIKMMRLTFADSQILPTELEMYRL